MTARLGTSAVKRTGPYWMVGVSGLAIAVGLGLAWFPVVVGAVLAVVLLMYGFLKRPNWSIPATVVVAFTATPAWLPDQVQVAGVVIFLFEVPLLGALIYCMKSTKPRRVAPAGFYLLGLVLLYGALVGLFRNYGLGPVNAEVRPFVDLLVAGFVSARTVARTDRAAAVHALIVSQYISAGLTLAASFGLVQLYGRTELASLTGDADAATRILSSAGWPSTVVMCGTAAAYMGGLITLRRAAIFLAPAATIGLLAFSRNTLLGIAIAVLVTGAWAVGQQRTLRLTSRTGTALLSMVVFALCVSLAARGGLLPGWLYAQFDSYQSRVLDSITGSRIAQDSSSRYRLVETGHLLSAIRQAPVFGYGFGFPYQPAVSGGGDFGSFTSGSGRFYAHNYYLWLAVKVGVPGLGLTVLVYAGAMLRAFRSPKVEVVPVLAAFAGLAVICVVAPAANGLPEALLFGGLLGQLWVVSEGLASARSSGLYDRSMLVKG